MNASDFDFREAATSEFINRGVGAKLTENSQALIRGLSEGDFSSANQWAISFACGSIIERVLLQSYGIGMGYFETVPPVTASEGEFLAEHSDLLKELDMPPQFQELCLRLGSPDSATDDRFYSETLPFIPLSREMPEWFPVFQASLITSELLTDPAITSFFLFLQRGDVRQFNQQMPDRNAVFSHLQNDDFTAPFRTDHERPEPVIAGFIRYTEFLSAVDRIFPDTNAESLVGTHLTIPDRIVDRDILFSIIAHYRWRFPVRGFERYQAVLMAFGVLATSEFARHPAMGIEFSFFDTFVKISRLTQKFFLRFNADDFQGDEDDRLNDAGRRRRAIDQRLEILRDNRARGASASSS